MFIDSTAPIIEVWYGENQQFGNLGTPQIWINILGNVSDPESSISTLYYSLNGVYQGTLNIGPDLRRLQNPGDFNIDISISDPSLVSGNNAVVITARNESGIYGYKTVNFTYSANNTWYLPYSIDWSNVNDPQDVIQIVDGEWQISSNGIRSIVIGYDRVIAIGDLIWQDVEIVVPVTINDYFHEDANNQLPWQSGNPGFGIYLHWTGHTDQPVNCVQPECGWYPYGGASWYEFLYDSADLLKLATQELSPVTTTAIQFNTGHTYWFKMRVEKNASGNLYKLRVWEDGTTQPSTWILSQQSLAENLPQGSILFVSHHVDATFGDVTIIPLNGDLTLTLTDEHGDINTDREAPYQYGEKVTLTAVADSGWVFDHWSEDLSGTENPESIIMTGDQSVTAVFTESPSYSITTQISPVNGGAISINPNKTTYAEDETVQFSAVPNAGFDFSHWSGTINSFDNPLSIQIQEDVNLTANFEPKYYSLDITSTQGTVNINPDQTSFLYNTPVQLSAVPNDGWYFSYWEGDINTNQNPTEFSITDNMQITAVYDQRVFIPILLK